MSIRHFAPTIVLGLALAACGPMADQSITVPSSARQDVSATATPGGLWSGTATFDDPAVGGPATYHLVVDFTAGTAAVDACGVPGTIESVTATEIVIAWGPDQPAGSCGREVVTYTITGSQLVAAGTETAYSDHREIPSQWALTRSDPLTKDDCKKGGWQRYGFRNQGECVSFVETGKDRR